MVLDGELLVLAGDLVTDGHDAFMYVGYAGGDMVTVLDHGVFRDYPSDVFGLTVVRP